MGINKPLRPQWSRKWSSLNTTGVFREVFPRVGEAWTTLYAGRESASATLIVALYLVGRYHIGVFFVSWGIQMSGWCTPGVVKPSLKIILFCHTMGCPRRDLFF